MLKIFQIERRSQIKDLFAQFESHNTSWIVSDLRTKFETQRQVLDQHSYFIETSVLRASDFWKILLKRTKPQYRIISRDFARSLLRGLLDDESAKLGINSSSERTVLTYMDQLHPFFFHPKGKETLNSWLQENPLASQRWHEWTIIANKCLEIFSQSGLITSKWIPGLLLEVPHLENYWSQKIWVDLGSEITKSEMDLFLTLSKSVDVNIIEPAPVWRQDHSYLLKPYDDVRGFAGQNLLRLKDPGSTSVSKKKTVLRFSGMLAEVRFATVQVRKWIEQGVAAEQIAVIAPDIEEYWPVLKPFFNQEGIPVNKSEMVKLSSLVTINRWMASQRSVAKSLSAPDLELSFYGRGEYEQINYDQFKALFSNIYTETDLHRHPVIEKIYLKTLKFEKRMSRDEYIAAALLLWDAREDIAPALQICREILQNASADIEMDLLEWIRYLEAVAANKELTIDPALESGVIVTKLMSAHSTQLQYRIFMGLCEENFRTLQRGGIPTQDLVSLSQKTGFNPENSDQTSSEFELRWIAESESSEDIFTVGMTDLTGSLLTPTAFWFTLNREVNKAHKSEASDPGFTRWDLLQRSELNETLIEERGISQSQVDKVTTRIAMDLGDKVDTSVQMSVVPTMSPSSVERYLSCPFQYTAAALFKLQSLPEIDLDVDSRTRGNLAHTLFQKITQMHPLRTDWSDQELEKLIEEIRQIDQFQFADEKLWPPLKNRYVKLAKRFLEVERLWRLEYPKTNTIKTEASWQVELSELGMKFRGRIDRIDTDDEDRVVVIDYKSSASGLQNHQKWIEERSLQLLFYMWAIEKNGVPDLKGEVIGAFYYVFKNLKREKGFQLGEATGILFPAKKAGPTGTKENKENLFASLEQLLLQMSNDLKSGKFYPEPIDKEICKRCDWRGLCRAPHLN